MAATAGAQQGFLARHGSEGIWTQEVTPLSLGSPCSLAGQMPLEQRWVSGLPLKGMCIQF